MGYYSINEVANKIAICAKKLVLMEKIYTPYQVYKGAVLFDWEAFFEKQSYSFNELAIATRMAREKREQSKGMYDSHLFNTILDFELSVAKMRDEHEFIGLEFNKQKQSAISKYESVQRQLIKYN